MSRMQKQVAILLSSILIPPLKSHSSSLKNPVIQCLEPSQPVRDETGGLEGDHKASVCKVYCPTREERQGSVYSSRGPKLEGEGR